LTPLQHLVFRRNSFSAYHIPSWNTLTSLPPGIAALFSSFCGAAMVVLGMDQVVRLLLAFGPARRRAHADSSILLQWWRGPIAKKIGGEAEYGGDVAIWLGMAVAALVYIPTRAAERKVFGR
jgi:purine-cytosine permease-like protein